MYKNKKMLSVLSTTAITGLMVAAINSTVFAKTTAIAVNSNDGKVYEYNYDALKESAIVQFNRGSSDPGAKLYNDFLQRKTTIKAYYDDIKKSYIESDTVSKEALNCVQRGTSFNLNSFTESASTPTTNLTTNTVSVDANGNLIINGQTVSSAVDMTSIECSNPINTFSTLISFKLSLSNPEDYIVTVKGKTASMDSTTGNFTAYVDGKISTSDIKASDFTITKKNLSNKPMIKSVTIVDSETICVKFNKTVDYTYATNLSNYKLLDSDGVDISNHISAIYSSISQTDTDTYNIKLKKCNPNNTNDDWRLTNSKYTLSIKNVIDTSSTPNAMDDYSCIINNDTTAPSGTGMYAKLRAKNYTNKDQVVVYFSKQMDTATLTNKDNYNFINGKGDTKVLPTDATVSAGANNKSAIIEFPSVYVVQTTGNKVLTDKEYDVLSLIVSNVKDESGNLLNGVAFNNNYIIPEANQGAAVKANTLKTYYDGDDLKVDFQFDRGIDLTNASDFTLGGVTPNSITHNGDIVTLTFKDRSLATASEISAHPITYANGKTNTSPTKIDVIKAQGQSAKLAINPTGTTDETGAYVSSTLSEEQASIYDYQAGPRTTCFDSSADYPDYWTATKDNNGVKIYITFDTPLDPNSGIKPDDIIFSSNGMDIKADEVHVDIAHQNTLVFSFNTTNKDYSQFAGSINVSIKSSIQLRTQKDVDGNNTVYNPSSDDLKVKVLKIIR